jgi:hypothetical protein
MDYSTNEWFKISNLDDFINASRILVYKNFGKEEYQEIPVKDILNILTAEETEELNSVLTFDESINISKNFTELSKNKDYNQNEYLINTQNYFKMLESFSNRMVSNILHNLVNKGQLETAFDETANDFVFWIKEDDTKK